MITAPHPSHLGGVAGRVAGPSCRVRGQRRYGWRGPQNRAQARAWGCEPREPRTTRLSGGVFRYALGDPPGPLTSPAPLGLPAGILPVVGYGGGPGASTLDTGDDSYIEDHCAHTRDVYGAGALVRFDITATQTTAGYTWSATGSRRIAYFIGKHDLRALINVHFRSSEAAYVIGGVSHTSVPDKNAAGKLFKLQDFITEACGMFGLGGSFGDGDEVTLDASMSSTLKAASTVGATAVTINNAAYYHAAGGKAVIGGDVFTYTGIDHAGAGGAARLVGIPATGTNALNAAHAIGAVIQPVETVSGWGSGAQHWETHNEMQQIGDCGGALLDPAKPFYPSRLYEIVRDSAEAIHRAHPDHYVVGFANGGMSHNPAASSATIAGRRDRVAIDVLAYANNNAAHGGNAPGLFGTEVATSRTAGSTTLPLANASQLPASGSVWAGGQTLTYTGKTTNTLTGIPVAGAGSITATLAVGARVSRSGNHIDAWSSHIYMHLDPLTWTTFNVRNINSMPALQTLIDSYPNGVLIRHWITEGHIPGSDRWNIYQRTYPLPGGVHYTVAAGSKAATDILWNGPQSVTWPGGTVHPSSQLDQETVTRHSAARMQQMKAAGLRLDAFIPHVAIDGKIPANALDANFAPWQHARGSVELPIIGTNYANATAKFTRYIRATPTGGRGGGYGGPQWKPVAYALYENFFLAPPTPPPPDPSLTLTPTDGGSDTTPSFAWTNTQTTDIEHRYRIDGGAWTTIAGQTGAVTTSALSYGVHTFEVQAHDTSSGLYSDILPFVWTITFVVTNVVPRTGFVPVVHKAIGGSWSIGNPSVPPGTFMAVTITKRDNSIFTVPGGWDTLLSRVSDDGVQQIRTLLAVRMTTGAAGEWPAVFSGLGADVHVGVMTAYDGAQGPYAWAAIVNNVFGIDSGGVSSRDVEIPMPVQLEREDCLVLGFGAISVSTAFSLPGDPEWVELFDQASALGQTASLAGMYRYAKRSDLPLPTTVYLAGVAGLWTGYELPLRGPVYSGPVIIDSVPTSGTVDTFGEFTYHHPTIGALYQVSIDGGAFTYDDLVDPLNDLGRVRFEGLAPGMHTFRVYAELPGGETTPVETRSWVQRAVPVGFEAAPRATRLGCGKYTAKILTRGGGAAVVQDAPWLELEWARTTDEPAPGKAVFATGGRTAKATLASVHSLEHEVVVARDGVDQYVGVVTGKRGLVGAVEFELADLSVWFGRRRIRVDLDFSQPTDAAEIAARVMEAAILPDNSMGLTVAWEPCGVKITKTVKAVDQRLASQVLEELRDYVDWTTVMREVRITPASDAGVRLFDEAFSEVPVPFEDGLEVSNDVTITGEGGGEDGPPITGHSDDVLSQSLYGLADRVESDTSLTTEDDADTKAEQLVSEFSEPPFVISGGAYSDRAPVHIAALVPGAEHMLDLATPSMPVLGVYRLAGLSVTAGGDGSEKVTPEYQAQRL